ncbi:hypothetical protein [Mycobacterium sp.]|uniref:hypothetical protein n=1 Tax=Mycobacterium sp. TaxID=1785 RepID=UPI00121B1731|nr:hypothetical protein [Mycobacterium sp.]TAM63550.1 MAG: hypothetical protein EPN51_26640 [Mycobacterium sp.]
MPTKAHWIVGLYMDDNGYYGFDGEMDADTFLTAARHVGRNNGPGLLLDLFCQGSIDVVKHPELVADVWSSAEFPVNNLDPYMWVELFDEAGYTHGGQPAQRPTQPIELYRGCHRERHLGISWTTDPARAQWFADRDLGKGIGHVYVHRAKPGELLAYIHTEHGRGEAEYVIDPNFLNDDNVHEAILAGVA